MPMTLDCRADGEATCTVSCWALRHGGDECRPLLKAPEPGDTPATVNHPPLSQQVLNLLGAAPEGEQVLRAHGCEPMRLGDALVGVRHRGPATSSLVLPLRTLGGTVVLAEVPITTLELL